MEEPSRPNRPIRKLPIGIQDFEKLKNFGFLYVQYGFLNNLYKYLFPAGNDINGLNAWTFIKALRSGDAVVKIRETVYVFEFKLDKSGGAEDALKQIDGKGYLIPYSAGGYRLVKAGVVFDTERRTLGEWKIR